MSYEVQFDTVSTVGLESFLVAVVFVGFWVFVFCYFKNKYDHVITVEPSAKA